MNPTSTTIRKTVIRPCRPSPQAKSAFLQRLYAQFGHPKGFWGIVVGMKMAFSRSNRLRMDWTISLLDIQPADRILEIGFGPGVSIRKMSRLAVRGYIAGIDISDLMVRQARTRNASAMREGRVDLRLASASDLPAFPRPFDKIVSMNSIQFWDEPVKQLKDLRNLLKPRGRIAITLQVRGRGATEDLAERAAEELSENLRKAGFSQLCLARKRMRPVSAFCAMGVRT